MRNQEVIRQWQILRAIEAAKHGCTIHELADQTGIEIVGSSGDVDEAIEALGDRAYGLAMLMLALPMAVPISSIPGISTVFGIPLILIAAQLMLGRPDRKSTRLNSSHMSESRMPSSA